MRPRRTSPRLRKIAADLYRPDHLCREPAPQTEVATLGELLDLLSPQKNAGQNAQALGTGESQNDRITRDEYPLDSKDATD